MSHPEDHPEDEEADQLGEMLGVLRGWEFEPGHHQMRISHSEGAYEIELTVAGRQTRGTGSTLAEAWESVMARL
jgi:hypothetical protein